MSSSMFSDNSCALCKNHRTPPVLNLHVSSSKTCADIHLELSLLDASQNEEKCSSGQSTYRSLCCQNKNGSLLSTEMQVSIGIIAGAMLLFFATKRVFALKIEGEKSPSDYKKMGGAPTKKKRSKSKERPKKKRSKDETAKASKPNDESTTGGDESLLAMWNGSSSS